MWHHDRGVKVVGLLLFLASETHWLQVGIGSILLLNKIFISFFFLFSYYFRNEIHVVIFLSRVISYDMYYQN